MNIFYQSICDKVNLQWLLANQEQNQSWSIVRTENQKKRYVTDSEDNSQDCVPPNPWNTIIL